CQLAGILSWGNPGIVAVGISLAVGVVAVGAGPGSGPPVPRTRPGLELVPPLGLGQPTSGDDEKRPFVSGKWCPGLTGGFRLARNRCNAVDK
ncbi:hypothetical protein OFB79_25310, partial [Escherichia coli]|nr:hypothetical protein [Escherichia coli]